MAFRLGAYIATQFKPVVAKCFYEMTNAKTVLDTSCGWGDRLCGFYATKGTTECILVVTLIQMYGMFIKNNV